MYASWILIEMLFKLFLYIGSTLTVVSACCDRLPTTTTPQCRAVCNQIAFDKGLEDQLQEVAALGQNCSRHLIVFWQCINDSFPVAAGSSDAWPGRQCCDVLLTMPCQNACRRAATMADLGRQCGEPGDEPAFLQCLQRQNVRAQCCGDAGTSHCTAMCKAVFLTDTPPTEQTLHAINDHCTSQVYHCVHNYTKTLPNHNPAENLHCCMNSMDVDCRKNCERILSTMVTDPQDKILDELMNHCGAPNPRKPLWQCFLTNSGNKPPQDKPRGIDGARMLCCSKANTPKCRDLCAKTYSRDWAAAWQKFHVECGFNALETGLQFCLQEIEEPCRLGCDGLSYCSNFNHRPTELFRSCNARADSAARGDFASWLSDGAIDMPLSGLARIPVKDVSSCQPERFKAIACSLQIKPCFPRAPANRICKRDCMQLLSECIDHSRLPYGHNAESVCNALSPLDEQAPCVSLDSYLQPGGIHLMSDRFSGGLTTPCDPNPCEEDHICVVNRRKCKHTDHCPHYRCKPACPLGEASTFLVPHRAYVRINANRHGNKLGCQRVCYCGHGNTVRHCVDIGCVQEKSCLLSSGRIEAHGRHFSLGCKQCSCYDGELVCSTRECLSSQASEQQLKKFTGLPCGCHDHFIPVCGVDGRTYPNSCIARCSNLTDRQFENGACARHKSCEPNPCRRGQRCVARRQVCLTLHKRKCPQYECVRVNANVPISRACSHHHHDPVCDVTGRELSNMCLLLYHGKKLAYRGHCMTGCEMSGRVCGHNGDTYPSECAAWADGTTVDYKGSCRIIGQLRVDALDPECAGIECPSVTPHCEPLTPPGTCCPICAGEIRVLYIQSDADMVTKKGKVGPITVQNLTQILSEHVTVQECGLFAYLSIEREVVILITPIVKKPSKLQIQACFTEAEKMGQLLASRSPTLISRAALSLVATATTRTGRVIELEPHNQYSVRSLGTTRKSLTLAWLTGIALLTVSCTVTLLSHGPR